MSIVKKNIVKTSKMFFVIRKHRNFVKKINDILLTRKLTLYFKKF